MRSVSFLPLSASVLALAVVGRPAAAGAEEPAQPSAAPAAPAAPANPPPTAQAARVILGDVEVYGEEVELDPAADTIIVTGNPRVLRGEDQVVGDRLMVNRTTRVITAEGHVVIRQGTQVTHADRATYDPNIREGKAENSKSVIDQYFVDADQLLLKQGPTGNPVYEALRATFTTCDKDRPHYSIYTRHLTIRPQDRLVAEHVGLNFLGHRLATIPRYSRSLKEGDGQSSLYPRFGYSEFYGFFAQKDFKIARSGPVWLDANVQLNTNSDPSAGILASTPGKGAHLVGALFYRDEPENQRARHMQVDRLPEVGVVWTQKHAAQPGKFLAHQVSNIHYPDKLRGSTGWIFGAELSGGYFRQHQGDEVLTPEWASKSGGRLTAQGQAVLPRLKLGPLRLNDLRFIARENVYDTGDSFTLLGTGIGKEFQIKHLRVGIRRFDQWTAGSTPFLFDDVEIREEWRPSLEYHNAGLSFSYTARIRADRGGLYNQIFSISKVFHCLEPRLIYETRQQRFFLELRIPGLTGYNRSQPGQPVTVDASGGSGAPEPPPPPPPPVQRQP